MSNIQWATATSGTWTTASDWTGGAAPSASDTAIISAVPQFNYESYEITLATPVTIAGLVMDARHATLYATAALNAGTVTLQAGTIEMNSAVLTGNVTQTGGTLDIVQGALAGNLTLAGGNAVFVNSTLAGTVTTTGGYVRFGGTETLNNVTWQGNLAAAGNGKLVINGGLTLTGANGSGAGTATFNNKVTLNGVSTLDNATITMAPANAGAAKISPNLVLQNTPTLTLGTGLTLKDATIGLLTNQTVTNNGTLFGTTLAAGIQGGTFVNNGLISGDFADLATRFTNNASITAGAGDVVTLALQGLTAAGANASIRLDGGNLVLDGNLTTAGLLALYINQHVITGAHHGFAVQSGTLNNTGATLSIGTGSTLGTLYAGATMAVTGGTIADAGGGELATLALNNVIYQSAAPTLALGSDNWSQATLSGATAVAAENLVLTDSTLNGVGTLAIGGSLTLADSTITGVGDNGQVSVTFVGALDSILTIAPGQSVAGYNFTFGDAASFNSGAVMLAGGNSLDHTSFAFNSGPDNAFVDSSALAGITFGSNFSASITNGDLYLLSQNAAAGITNDGSLTVNSNLLIGASSYSFLGAFDTYFTNTGTITVGAGGWLAIDAAYGHLDNMGTLLVNGGTLEASATDLTNSGDLSVTNGTLILDGPLSVPDLTLFSHPGSQLDIAGNLDLGGKTLAFGSAALQQFTLLGGDLSDGTLTIGHGKTLVAQTYGDFSTPVISANLINNGTLIATLGNASVDQSTTELSGNITGTGTIELTSGGTGSFTNFCDLKIDGTVGSGQAIAFISGYDTLEFGNLAAAQNFAGTISGLDSAAPLFPTITFDNETISSASISGNHLLVDFTNGIDISLTTSTDLAGSLSILNSAGNGEITYAAATPAAEPAHWASPAHWH